MPKYYFHWHDPRSPVGLGAAINAVNEDAAVARLQGFLQAERVLFDDGDESAVVYFSPAVITPESISEAELEAVPCFKCGIDTNLLEGNAFDLDTGKAICYNCQYNYARESDWQWRYGKTLYDSTGPTEPDDY